jgi:hypothetical protein
VGVDGIGNGKAQLFVDQAHPFEDAFEPALDVNVLLSVGRGQDVPLLR